MYADADDDDENVNGGHSFILTAAVFGQLLTKGMEMPSSKSFKMWDPLLWCKDENDTEKNKASPTPISPYFGRYTALL